MDEGFGLAEHEAPAHGFHRTIIDHHKDGSHTVKHRHVSKKHVTKAVPDLEGVHQSLHDNIGGGQAAPMEPEPAPQPGAAAPPAPMMQ